MLKIREYVKAESLEQAYELNQKKTSCIIGGMLWLKMSDRMVQKAIDLSGLGLDQTEEDEDEIRIGAMVSLRQMELHPGLEELSGGAVREALRHIVGVQFRNLATVGGSIFGRFGFSDVLTCLLALDTYVELYKGGTVSLQEFAQMPRDNDILVRIIIRKKPMRCVYLSHRNTSTDFPVLACCISVDACKARAVVGARPGKAMVFELPEEFYHKMMTHAVAADEIRDMAEQTAAKVPTADNMRGSGAYRTHLAKVLLRRGLEKLQEDR